MKSRVLSACVIAIIALGTATPLLHAREARGLAGDDARDEAKAQVEFGIKVAQKKLWREATYRFEKATEIDPTYAAGWNNLAISYEEQGRMDDAKKAYDRALKLDGDNTLIRQNYDLFMEIYERLKRRNRSS